jgi:hypothetical protein
MSKKRKRFTNTGNTQLRFPGLPAPASRSADEVDADVMRAASGTGDKLPSEIMAAVTSAKNRVFGQTSPTKWDYFKGYDFRAWESHSVTQENEFIRDLVMAGIDEGFRLAIERYAVQLKHVPELAAWRKKRKRGGDIGRENQIRAKEDNARKAQTMLAQGADIADIAREIGRSVPTVYRLLKVGADGKPAKRQRPRRR